MKRSVLALLLISAGFVAGLVVTARLRTVDDIRAAPPETQAQKRPLATPAPSAPAGSLDFTRIAEQAVGGVTNISAIQAVRSSARSPFSSDPFFRYFFGDDDDFYRMPRERREASLGSGVIVSGDGYVMTNHHVIGESVRDITVTLSDKREVRARVVGTDRVTDLALLRVDARNLPTMTWGDSSQLKVGEWVLAVGNPFQLNQTVTLGIVSAVGRANVGIADYEDFIQTDAAINPGNSGGALVNARGELVGINTAIYSQSGGYQGIGFAVPSNLAHRVAEELKQHGVVRRGSIGSIEVAPISDRIARELGLPSLKGTLVYRLARGSPAHEAGLQPGDVIIAFNRQPVEDASHFLRLLADAKIGSTVSLTVTRDGRNVEIRVPVIASSRRG